MLLSTLTTAFLLGLVPLSKAAALSPLSDSLEDTGTLSEREAPAHYLASMDITDGVPTTPAELFDPSDQPDFDLQPRRRVDYCRAQTGSAGGCKAVAGVVDQIGSAIASDLKKLSNANSCGVRKSKENGVHWKVHAGGTCHTTAETVTIEGAVDNYLRDVGEDVCAVHCLRMTHGGGWVGFVEIAPVGVTLDNFKCGPAVKFGNCGSGGKKDAYN